MSENLVEVKHLQQYFPAGGMGKNKRYVQAVDDVSFAIRKGETLGLVGESGCGKTTTGRTLLRLYEPTDGTIIYDGKVLFDKKEKIAVDMLPYRRRMQIVFQDPYWSLNPRWLIKDIVAEPLDVYEKLGEADRLKRVTELLEMVEQGIELKKCEYCHRYFIPFSSKALYCDRSVGDTGKSCKELAVKEKHEKKIAADDGLKLIRQRIKTYDMRVRRTPAIYTDAAFQIWKAQAENARNRYVNGELTYEELAALTQLPKKKGEK